jgi:hypothetical protein
MVLAACVLAGAGTVTTVAEIPLFVDTFETRNAGRLDSQGGWTATPAGRVRAQEAVSCAGRSAAMLATNSLLACMADDVLATNVWVDFYARACPRACRRPPCLSPDAVAGFYVMTNGFVAAYSNDTWVTLNRYRIQPDQWFRFSANLDYKARRWGLYAATNTRNRLSVTLATNLAFRAQATAAHFHSFRIKN